ncbi:hypothetical protein [Halobacteriovorax sp. HLS]|uniref:hypothetical protein n=1 Tax=Halobacteriovorax sp. HLS TaxID=2234000 RepID=UPI000FDAB51B|nr:hypothetical protein [Halobacteriovorax sp. HLS]
MKRILLGLLFLVMSTVSIHSNEGEVLTLTGKFINKSGQAVSKKYGTDYFFQIKDESGKVYAYPVVIKDAKTAQKISKNKSKIFTVVAVPTQKKHQVGEVASYVHVLSVLEANTFSMKSLSVRQGDIQDQGPDIPYYDRSKTKQQSPTFNISDTAANSIIFAAGAALLGGMLIK